MKLHLFAPFETYLPMKDSSFYHDLLKQDFKLVRTSGSFQC